MLVLTADMDSSQPQQYQDEPHAAALRKAVCAAAGLEDTDANAEHALKKLAGNDQGKLQLRCLLQQHGSFTSQVITQVRVCGKVCVQCRR